MSKLLLASILIASIVIPYTAASARDANTGLRTVLIRSAMFMLAYSFMLRFIYPRLQ